VNRLQLEYLIWAAAENADTREIVGIGSQSILGAYPEVPSELLVPMEADIHPKDRPENSTILDGAIGHRRETGNHQAPPSTAVNHGFGCGDSMPIRDNPCDETNIFDINNLF
jgi:hypothetical protein